MDSIGKKTSELEIEDAGLKKLSKFAAEPKKD